MPDAVDRKRWRVGRLSSPSSSPWRRWPRARPGRERTSPPQCRTRPASTATAIPTLTTQEGAPRGVALRRSGGPLQVRARLLEVRRLPRRVRSGVHSAQEEIAPVDCASCHDDIGSRHAFHRRLGLNPVPAGADTSCTGCHGTHAIAASGSPAFPFVRARQAEACGRCHQAARDQFAASAHGRAFGAADAPSCLVCHQKAIVSPVRGTPDIAVKLAQAALCESCHVDKPAVADQALRGTHFVAASFDKSVHGSRAAHRAMRRQPTASIATVRTR